MKKCRLLLCMMIIFLMPSTCLSQWVWVSSDSEITRSYDDSFQRIYVDGVEAVSIWQKQDIRKPEFDGYVIYEYAYDLETDKYFIANATATFNDDNTSWEVTEAKSQTGNWYPVNYDSNFGKFLKVALTDYHNQKENR